MTTILKPCSVPWAVSPTGGLTLVHSQDDVWSCTIVIGGGRLTSAGQTDFRRIEVVFDGAGEARVGSHRDDEDIRSIGYEVERRYDGPVAGYLDWRRNRWTETGLCPDPRFYVATQSEWAAPCIPGIRHYVVDGCDGYIELLARGFVWREGLWTSGERDSFTDKAGILDQGEGVD